MDAIVTRYQLPDSWSGKGACLVCRTSGSLRVVHEEILPDRMQCSACGAEFELESGGAHVRLLALPEALAGRAPELLGTWLLPGAVPPIERPGAGAQPEPFANDRLPSAPTPSATTVDAVAADPPPSGTDTLRRAAESTPARAGTTRPLKPPQGERKALGPLPRSLGTAPLTAPARAKRTTISMTPELLRATPPAVAGPASDLTALNEELDTVLKMLPERPARSDEALADELARVMAELPAVAPEAAAHEAVAESEAATFGLIRAAAATVGEASEVVSTQQLARDTPAETVDFEDETARMTSAEIAAWAIAHTDEARMVTLGDPREAVTPHGEAALNDDEPDTVAAVAAAAPPVLDSARVAKFSEQGDKLRQFGNSVEVIRATLERSGASPEELEAALANIVGADALRLRSFQRTLQWVGGAALLILLLLVAVVLVISRPAPAPEPVGAAMRAAHEMLAIMLTH